VTPPPTIAHPEVVTRGVPKARPGWIERATSADHKSVALLYLGSAMTFLVVAVAEFVLMRIQLITPDATIIHPEIFARILSASGVTLTVLFAVPLVLGLIGYVVPLQIGARGVAFPRLGLLSAWLYIVGGAAIYLSFLWTAPDGGVLGLPPLTDTVFTPSHGVDAWIVGTGLAVLGFVCFAINLIATIRNMRAPGMARRRMPLFSWAAGVIGYVLLMIGPVMLAALTMLMIDRHFSGVFFDSAEGGAPLLFEHFSYIFFTGIYVIVLVFAGGVISEILPPLSRKPIFSHRAVAGSFVAIAVMGTLAWMQNMYFAPIDAGWGYFAMVMSIGLAVPIGILLFTWIGTLWSGSIRMRAPMLYALAAISTLVFGLAGELAYSVIPVGWQLGHTTASQGDTLYVFVGGAVFGGFAALHYWLPKITGRVVSEGTAKAALVVMLIGVHLYVIPMFLAGLEGQPVDVYKFFSDEGVSAYNAIASIGAFVVAIGIFLELGTLAHSYGHGLPTGPDPWGGSTLEWFALSPPPPHNFDAVPDVRSGEPLLDIREAVRRRTEAWEAPEPLEVRTPAAAPAEGDAGDDAPLS
jgi:heme/copper-type cytochrome/quinol oxidase subunit 1